MANNAPKLFINNDMLLQSIFEIRKLGVHLMVNCTSKKVGLSLLHSSRGNAGALIQILRCENFLVHNFIQFSRLSAPVPASLANYFRHRGWMVCTTEPGV